MRRPSPFHSVPSWGKGLIGFCLLGCSALLPPCVQAKVSPEIQNTFQEGLNALYNTDYAQAYAIFQKGLAEHPQDDALLFGLACVDWWRLENTFALPGSSDEEMFRQDVNRAIAQARRDFQGPDPAMAYLCAGGAYGVRGRREAARHHWWRAYLDGRRAYLFQKRALSLDPSLYDAYLGVGAFDYFISTLPHAYRVLSFLHLGDRAAGLHEIHLAAERSMFSQTAAQLLLAGIDWKFEKNPQDAAMIIDGISRQYPHSPFIEFLRLISIYRLHDAAGLGKEARAYLDRIDRGEPYYKPSDRIQGYLLLGLSQQLSGDYDTALETYNRALQVLPARHPGRGVAFLFMGECQDLLSQRPSAIAFYHQALRETRLWAVHPQARELLKNPFHAGDDPLPHEFAIHASSQKQNN